MTSSDASLAELPGIVDAMSRAVDLAGAYTIVIDEVERALGVRSCVFQEDSGEWRLAAPAEGDVGIPLRETTLVIERLCVASPARPALTHPLGGIVWTVLCPPPAPGAPRIALLLGGVWPDSEMLLGLWARLIAAALAPIAERQSQRPAAGLAVQAYAMLRRLSRLESTDRVCQRIVDHVARLLNAERVALALHRPAEDRLSIAATHGYPLADVRDVRIAPGAWVIGHVHASRRPVFVRDVRRIGGEPREARRYRTFSFGAVPMLAGLEGVGVLTATDKRDGSPFDRQDMLLLRTAGVVAALAVVAARYDIEVHQLAYTATIDSLTGLLNRRALDTRLHQEVERARRDAGPLALLIADVDNFKLINDTFGHQAGDAVLRGVGRILRSAVRVFDVCARYGGDEFAILMPDSDLENAISCAHRMCRLVADLDGDQFGAPSMRSVTVSIGVAVMSPGDAPSDLVRRADRCLYQAKAEGKNRVSAEGTRPPEIRRSPGTA